MGSLYALASLLYVLFSVSLLWERGGPWWIVFRQYANKSNLETPNPQPKSFTEPDPEPNLDPQPNPNPNSSPTQKPP